MKTLNKIINQTARTLAALRGKILWRGLVIIGVIPPNL